MPSSLSSIDAMIAAARTHGTMNRVIYDILTTVTTAGSLTSGAIGMQRMPSPLVIPAMGAGVTGCYPVVFDMVTEDANTIMVAALEYTLGSLAVGTGVFTAGVSMPTKTVEGEAILTASIEPMLVVRTSITGATTPLITITYTNQDGVTGRTAQLTLPTNPVIHGAYRISPHFQSGDTGMRAVTGMTKSVGSGGVLDVMGLLLIHTTTAHASAGSMHSVPPLSEPTIMWKLTTGERIALYRTGALGGAIVGHVVLLPETE